MYDVFLITWPLEGRLRKTLGELHGVPSGDVEFVPEDAVAFLSSLRDQVLLVEYDWIGGDFPLHLIVIPRFRQRTVPVSRAAARLAHECFVAIVAGDGSDNPARWLRYMPDGRIVPIRVDPHRADALYVVPDDAESRVAD